MNISKQIICVATFAVVGFFSGGALGTQGDEDYWYLQPNFPIISKQEFEEAFVKVIKVEDAKERAGVNCKRAGAIPATGSPSEGALDADFLKRLGAVGVTQAQLDQITQQAGVGRPTNPKEAETYNSAKNKSAGATAAALQKAMGAIVPSEVCEEDDSKGSVVAAKGFHLRLAGGGMKNVRSLGHSRVMYEPDNPNRITAVTYKVDMTSGSWGGVVFVNVVDKPTGSWFTHTDDPRVPEGLPIPILTIKNVEYFFQRPVEVYMKAVADNRKQQNQEGR